MSRPRVCPSCGEELDADLIGESYCAGCGEEWNGPGDSGDEDTPDELEDLAGFEDDFVDEEVLKKLDNEEAGFEEDIA